MHTEVVWLKDIEMRHLGHRARPIPELRLLDGPLAAAVRDHIHNLIVHVPMDQLTTGSMQTNPVVLKLLKRRTRFTRDDAYETAMRRYLARATPRRISQPEEPLASNVCRLGEMLQLTATDLDILRLAFALVDSWILRDVVTSIGRTSTSVFARLVAAAVARPVLDVTTALASSGRLARCGLLEIHTSGDMEDRLVPKVGLVELLAASNFDRGSLFERFLPEVGAAPPEWLDHSHIEEEVALARKLLQSAVNGRERGVNVLLYGDTGTGKSSLARALARDLAVPLYAAQRDDDSAGSLRTSTLLLGLEVVEPGKGLMLFDELEDLFERGGSNTLLGRIGTVMSKDGFNRLLEDNRVPVIWTTNHVRHVDRAFLRRFSHAIEVRAGGVRQRARVLKHLLERPLDTAAPELDTIATRFDASPAQVTAATRAARLLGEPVIEHIGQLLAGTCRLLNGRGTNVTSGGSEPYCVEALNASTDVSDLASQLELWRPSDGPGITMCLYGAPGTGKSEYIRYLARRIGRVVSVRRASSLLSPFVGETEANLARAFDQTSVEDEILVIDEVDSFLADRREATRAWEVSQVNEFLQQLEAFRGIVACTTNRWDALDPAVRRRFVFKVEMRPPTTQQVVALFWAIFDELVDQRRNSSIDAALMATLAPMRPTPGDMAAVRRRLVALRTFETNVERVLEEIAAEVDTRGSRVTGFSRAGDRELSGGVRFAPSSH